MKKITYALIIFILSITIVKAQPCFIISGTGKNIGDEIACGSEHFYVVSNDGKEVKMLGKYNLMVGDKYDYIEFEEFEFSNWYDIYKIKEVQDRVNEKGILLSPINKQWDDTTQKYKTTSASGTTSMTNNYKVVVLDTEVDSPEIMVENSETKKLLNEGYYIYRFLYSYTDTQRKCYGVILKKVQITNIKQFF